MSERSNSSRSGRPTFGANTIPVHPNCALVHIPSSKIGDLAAQFQSKAIDPSAVLMTHNTLGFSYEDRAQDIKGRIPMMQPKWLLQQHVETHTTLALAYAHTTNEGIPCEAPNCNNSFNIANHSCQAMCSVHVCSRCHNGFWCSKTCYEDSICLHGIRCYDSPAYTMSDYTFNALWPQYQAVGASHSSSSSSQTPAPHPVAQTNMGPPATVNRTDTTPAITNWPTQPGLDNGILCPTSGWITQPPETKYGSNTYSHPQVHQGIKFEYHKIRGAYILHKERNPTKRLDYGSSFKLFLATQAELDSENKRIDAAKQHRRPTN
jgi:hypothetical protein